MADPNVLERARVAGGEELAALLHHGDASVLLALLDNPALVHADVCVLLCRRTLPGDVVEEISSRRAFLKSYAVKRALACHPRTPRLVTLRLLKDLYLMDLVQIALLPGISAELKRNAEDQLLSRLPQLPLGQKITLARRGPSRVAALLLAQGHPQVLAVAMDNTNLTAAQILKVLAQEGVPVAVIHAIAQHPKWSCDYNVRLALVRNPASTLTSILAYLPDLTASDLRLLAEPGIVPERLRKYLQAEVLRRIRAGQRIAKNEDIARSEPPSKE
jgi:hypothetical protein